jgi:hypothetical protein
MQLPAVTTVASGGLRSARRALRTGAALSTDETTWLGFWNPNQVRPISGDNKSCALNSLDMASSFDDQVHVPAPKLTKNLRKTIRADGLPDGGGWCEAIRKTTHSDE